LIEILLVAIIIGTKLFVETPEIMRASWLSGNSFEKELGGKRLVPLCIIGKLKRNLRWHPKQTQFLPTALFSWAEPCLVCSESVRRK
jgi:hypothetical protein